MQCGIDSAKGQKLLVSAALYDFAILKHQDKIGSADGAESMGDDKSGTALEKYLQSPL